MIAFRHADPRFPFLREDASQPAGRWNASGDLALYFCDTPDGAWAEFLRHEEIRDPEDLSTIRRALWAVEIGEEPSHQPSLPSETLLGGTETWPECQQWAAERSIHVMGITAPSAALCLGGAHGWRVDGGLHPGPQRDGKVFVLFEPRPDVVGWLQLSAAIPVNISYQTSGTSRDPLFSRAQRSMSKMSKRLKA